MDPIGPFQNGPIGPEVIHGTCFSEFFMALIVFILTHSHFYVAIFA